MMRIVIAGTGVPTWMAGLAYSRFADQIGADTVVGIPHLGLGHCATAADRLREQFGHHEQVELVGHSQGGLVAAILANWYPTWVRRTVTLSAPLRGTPLSNFAVPVAGFRCMAPGARLTRHLKGNRNMLCVAGEHDLLVPPAHASVPGARTRTFPVGHLRIIADPHVASTVAAHLTEGNERRFYPKAS